MKHDIFEFCMNNMTTGQRAWRIALLVCLVAVLAYDLFVGRPG